MKKIICMLLMLLFAIPALSEEAPLTDASPFAPYRMTVPDSVELVEKDGTFTYVYGPTRVVAMVIDRVPDEKPEEAIIRMMGQFEPDAVIGESIPAAEGYVGIRAVCADKFGEGEDQLIVMILGAQGDLLILSGYDMNGSEEHAQSLLDALLTNLTADGVHIVIREE